MSVRIMSLAWEAKVETHTQKLVLISLADNANDQGICWPAIATIAKRCCLTERCVFDQIASLEKLGLIKHSSGGGKTSNTYDLSPLNTVQGTPEQGSGHPCTAFRAPLNTVHPNRNRTVIEPSLNQESESVRLEKRNGIGSLEVSPSLVKIRSQLSEAYCRAPDDPWEYGEESTLCALIKARPKFLSECDEILRFKSKEDPKFFPHSLSTLLNSWPSVLDRARIKKTKRFIQPTIPSAFTVDYTTQNPSSIVAPLLQKLKEAVQ